MTTIHITDVMGKQSAFSEDEARALWQQGTISRQALYWKEGMPEWRPAAEFFEPSGAALPAIPSGRPARRFVKDPAFVTRFLTVILWLYLALAAIGAAVASVSLATGNATRGDDADLSVIDGVELAVGLVQIVVFLITGIVFLRWIYLANLNARGFGARDMQFTPAWSVGWYFIPVLNLWKPFQAMKEIWQASRNPNSPSSEQPPAFLTAWWSLWLLTNVLGQMSLRLSLRGEQMAVAAEICTLLADLVDIPLCLLAARLVKSTYQMQRGWVADHAAA